MSDFPCRVEADLRIYESRVSQSPSAAEIEGKKEELILNWLESEENAHEAISESITHARLSWKPFYQDIFDNDDAHLGLLLRRELVKYAERCTKKRLQNWIEEWEPE